MSIERELNEFFTELNEAASRMEEMLSRVESVVEEGLPQMANRKEEVAVVVSILAEAISRGGVEDGEAFANAIATLYLLGFYDGKQKGGGQ